MKKAVVVFSGGIDSVSTCAYLKPRYELYGISFLYGQKASQEIRKAKKFAKILGLKKGCTKEEIIKAANGLQKKIHPDVNPNSNTERLSQIVNEAKETALKDFS